MSSPAQFPNGLYPIIRRVRRPLVVADAPPAVVENVEPVQPVAVKVEDENAVVGKLKQPSEDATDN